jgi:hypothetical protein
MTWYNGYKEQLKAEGKFDSITWVEFSLAYIQQDEPLTLEEMTRATLNAMYLKDRQSPKQFNQNYRVLSQKIKRSTKESYFAYVDALGDEYRDKVEDKDIDFEKADALLEAMRVVERTYAKSRTGRANVIRSNSSHGPASLKRVSKVDHPGAVAFVGQDHSAGHLSNTQGSQRIDSESYSGCHECGSLDHYARDCPQVRAVRRENRRESFANKAKGKQQNDRSSRRIRWNDPQSRPVTQRSRIGASRSNLAQGSGKGRGRQVSKGSQPRSRSRGGPSRLASIQPALEDTESAEEGDPEEETEDEEDYDGEE